MADKIITQATVEPLSLAEVIEYLRVDSNPADQDTIEALITSARQYVEQYLNRYIATQTIEMAMTGFKDEIYLSAPLQSVTYIKYLDKNGVEQTLNSSQYLVDTYSEPAVIRPAYAVTYPETYAVANNVKVRYVAGYTTGGSPDTLPIPKPILYAIQLVIGDLYANREAQGDKAYQINPTVMNLLTPYRINIGM